MGVCAQIFWAGVCGRLFGRPVGVCAQNSLAGVCGGFPSPSRSAYVLRVSFLQFRNFYPPRRANLIVKMVSIRDIISYSFCFTCISIHSCKLIHSFAACISIHSCKLIHPFAACISIHSCKLIHSFAWLLVIIHLSIHPSIHQQLHPSEPPS